MHPHAPSSSFWYSVCLTPTSCHFGLHNSPTSFFIVTLIFFSKVHPKHIPPSPYLSSHIPQSAHTLMSNITRSLRKVSLSAWHEPEMHAVTWSDRHAQLWMCMSLMCLSSFFENSRNSKNGPSTPRQLALEMTDLSQQQNTLTSLASRLKGHLILPCKYDTLGTNTT